jgi:phosphate transport system permease protein
VSRDRRRRWVSRAFVGLSGASIALALAPLALVLFYVAQHGLSALSWSFFVRMPRPVGEAGGGMANAIVGTLLLIGLAAVVAVPVGVLSGIHLAEYGRSRFAFAVRFAADVLNGVPSIVVGIFAYGLFVLPFRRFSALAGGFALGVMMIPLVTRTTEELLKLVPVGYRDGALALGASRTRALLTIVLPAALPGVITGILVAVARIAGETAPLLFTSFGNRFWSTNPLQPIGSLPVQIYTYAISPYEDWHRQAWAGALVLVGLVLALSLFSRAALRRLEKMHRA